jgi:hypothetical protein
VGIIEFAIGGIIGLAIVGFLLKRERAKQERVRQAQIEELRKQRDARDPLSDRPGADREN